ncbi:MAG: hypothetical protein SNJ64_02190 [Endomicrobiia bacterium]
MSISIVLPICGKSKRYDYQHKWNLKNIYGSTMLEVCVSGIRNYKNINKYIIYNTDLKPTFRIENTYFIRLNFETRDVIETVKKFLELEKISDHLAIKDCDNFFITELDYNTLYYYELDWTIKAEGKSFIEESGGKIEKIYEKSKVLSKFCCGLYSLSVDEFINAESQIGSLNRERYLSDIFNIYPNKKLKKVISYRDWGSKENFEDFYNFAGIYYV